MLSTLWRWLRHPLCTLESLRRPSGAPPGPEALRRHAEAEAAGRPSYPDPDTGREVWTGSYLRDHLERCCDLGCRHCPWP